MTVKMRNSKLKKMIFPLRVEVAFSNFFCKACMEG